MNRKRVPTTYRGVTYRSRSEAAFARCVDKTGLFKKGTLRYEPFPKGLYQHEYDFTVESQSNQTLIIEYKPFYPSDSLIQRFTEAAKKDIAVMHGQRVLPDWFGIIHGSGWNKEKDHINAMWWSLIKIRTTKPDVAPEPCFRQVQIIPDHIALESTEYRYDLALTDETER